MSETVAVEGEPYRHRFPLGLILLAKGWITNSQLRHALDIQQREPPRPIGQWLIEECGTTPGHIARALGMQWGCPVLRIDEFDPATMALTLPKFLVETLEIVPIRIARDRVLYLGRGGHPDPSAAFAIERMSGLRVVSGLIDPDEQRRAQERIAACAGVDATVVHTANFESMALSIASAVTAAAPRASRLVCLHQFFWLRMWLEAGAMSTSTGGFPRTREDVVDYIYIHAPGGEQ